MYWQHEHFPHSRFDSDFIRGSKKPFKLEGFIENGIVDDEGNAVMPKKVTRRFKSWQEAKSKGWVKVK